MIVCDVCKKNAEYADNSRVTFGLLPVEINSHTIQTPDWVDANTGLFGQGMVQYIHSKCWDMLMSLYRGRYSDPKERYMKEGV